MLRQTLILVLAALLAFPAAAADPLLLLLLRMMRDQVIATSIERGVGLMRQEPSREPVLPGYALATPPVVRGTEEQRLRELIDESFLHLTSEQRDAVYASMQKILHDPQHAAMKAQIIAEFTVKAHGIRDSYRILARLSAHEKRMLARQAREEFTRLSPDDRRQMMQMLQSGMLPVPRDLNSIMLAEISAVASSP